MQRSSAASRTIQPRMTDETAKGMYQAESRELLNCVFVINNA
jgi:hypothetical protein